MSARHAARLRMCSALTALAVMAAPGHAQTPIESSAEIRFQLDLQVPDAALKPLIPAGFSLNVATQGAAKDCNLRAVFIDRVTIHTPDGKPIGKGSNRLVYLAAPVKDAVGSNAQLVIGGMTGDPGDAPGPFGNYLHATTATVKRAISGEGANVTETQDWVFRTASGEQLELHITFERGVGNRGQPSETRFYSAKNPATYQISKQEQVLEILRNPTTNPPDRVKQYSFKGSGGQYAKLFDGTEKTVSWDNILWMMRTVSNP